MVEPTATVKTAATMEAAVMPVKAAATETSATKAERK